MAPRFVIFGTMKKHWIAILLVSGCSTAAAGQSIKNNLSDSIPASALKPVGRYRFTPSSGLELISTAAHFGFSFKGVECAVYVSLPEGRERNYLQYEVDGSYQKRVIVYGDKKDPLIIRAAATGNHKVIIYKTTEAISGPVFITGIKATAAKALAPAKSPTIEFIGNSITSGAAADTASFPCSAGNYNDHHNGYMAYGPRVARALGADYLVTSVSGIGIYRTWNLDSPSMPLVYRNTDLQTSSPDKWDFSRNRPGIISIALGTNDMSNGDGKSPRKPFDSAVFVSEYVKFVKLVKGRYPEARIILLSSPMIKDDRRRLLERCLTAVKQQMNVAGNSRKPVSTYFFKTTSTNGCGGHPSVSDHGLMATELIPVFRKLLAQNRIKV